MEGSFTSESVTEGHPDKLCGCVADAVLDTLLAQEPLTRYACEVTAVSGLLHIMGEITSNIVIDCEQIACSTIREIGYNRDEYGSNADRAEVRCDLYAQFPGIVRGVVQAENPGAGGQGRMLGYA